MTDRGRGQTGENKGGGERRQGSKKRRRGGGVIATQIINGTVHKSRPSSHRARIV